MSPKLEHLRTLGRESPVGAAALVMAVVCGGFFLALVEVPSFVLPSRVPRRQDGLGHRSGFGDRSVLAQYSLALERRLGPAWAAGGFLLVAENTALIMMPIWTAMVFAGKSGWLSAIYLLGLFIALVLPARRLVSLWTARN